jgi:chromosome segregation ATPase
MAKQKGATKGSLITAVIFSVLVLISGILAYSWYQGEHNALVAKMDDERTSYTNQLSYRDSVINDWLMTFDEIEKDLKAIKDKEQIITMRTASSEFANDRKNQVLDDIKYINAVLDKNKEKIASLNSQLKKSGSSVKALNNKITRLESSLKEYENNIAELKKELVKKDYEIGQLNTRMTAQEVTITEQGEKIDEQSRKMNQAYIASGTLKDLKKKGIISKEGGFLGLGRRELVARDFSDNAFQKIDVTETKTIPVNSREAKLITVHPVNSYRMIKEGKGNIASIEIKDPDQFWKVSRYAVVQIAR